MRHFVQYHNVEKLGQGCCEDPWDNFAAVTRKAVPCRRGDIIWLVAGEGRPRRYSLCKRFTVEAIEPEVETAYRFRISGKRGTQAQAPIPIDQFAWFPAFLKGQQNFSLGLREIDSRYAHEFESLLHGPVRV